MNQLAEALRLLRVFHDWSQTALAHQLEISKSFLSEIESGKKEPTLSLLNRYARVFDMPVSSLLFFAERVEQGSSQSATSRVAPKVLKLLDWVSAAKDVESLPARKPAQKQLTAPRQASKFGS